jgi:hypothetical protein
VKARACKTAQSAFPSFHPKLGIGLSAGKILSWQAEWELTAIHIFAKLSGNGDQTREKCFKWQQSLVDIKRLTALGIRRIILILNRNIYPANLLAKAPLLMWFKADIRSHLSYIGGFPLSEFNL